MGARSCRRWLESAEGLEAVIQELKIFAPTDASLPRAHVLVGRPVEERYALRFLCCAVSRAGDWFGAVEVISPHRAPRDLTFLWLEPSAHEVRLMGSGSAIESLLARGVDQWLDLLRKERASKEWMDKREAVLAALIQRRDGLNREIAELMDQMRAEGKANT